MAPKGPIKDIISAKFPSAACWNVASYTKIDDVVTFYVKCGTGMQVAGVNITSIKPWSGTHAPENGLLIEMSTLHSYVSVVGETATKLG